MKANKNPTIKVNKSNLQKSIKMRNGNKKIKHWKRVNAERIVNVVLIGPLWWERLCGNAETMGVNENDGGMSRALNKYTRGGPVCVHDPLRELGVRTTDGPHLS